MKVMCIVPEYFDKEEQEYIKKDDVLEVDEKRGKSLINSGMVEEVKVDKEATAKK